VLVSADAERRVEKAAKERIAVAIVDEVAAMLERQRGRAGVR
jgi:hypothetical protein